jgi:hypothetical protein
LLQNFAGCFFDCLTFFHSISILLGHNIPVLINAFGAKQEKKTRDNASAGGCGWDLDLSVLYEVERLPAQAKSFSEHYEPLRLPAREKSEARIGYNWIAVATK